VTRIKAPSASRWFAVLTVRAPPIDSGARLMVNDPLSRGYEIDNPKPSEWQAISRHLTLVGLPAFAELGPSSASDAFFLRF